MSYWYRGEFHDTVRERPTTRKFVETPEVICWLDSDPDRIHTSFSESKLRKFFGPKFHMVMTRPIREKPPVSRSTGSLCYRMQS